MPILNYMKPILMTNNKFFEIYSIRILLTKPFTIFFNVCMLSSLGYNVKKMLFLLSRPKFYTRISVKMVLPLKHFLILMGL